MSQASRPQPQKMLGASRPSHHRPRPKTTFIVEHKEYVHGRWAVPAKYGLTGDGSRNPNEPILAFVPLDFDMSPNQPDKSIYMTIAEFSAHVELAEALFSRYWVLCEKHIGHALPRRPTSL